MAEDQFPSIGVRADAESITIRLPSVADTTIPRIPEELRGEDLPSFVAEWILESDEIGVLIQELLQAPTKSLCRIFELPTNAEIGATQFPQLGNFQFGAPTVRRPVYQSRFVALNEVSGFQMEEEGVMAALPEGVQLPERLFVLTEIAARVGAWIEKGFRVRAWAEERGHGDASWLPATG